MHSVCSNFCLQVLIHDAVHGPVHGGFRNLVLHGYIPKNHYKINQSHYLKTLIAKTIPPGFGILELLWEILHKINGITENEGKF